MTNETIKDIDPNILLSVVNTKLRDNYSSLDILCEDLELSKDIIINKLKTIDYIYDNNENRFK